MTQTLVVIGKTEIRSRSETGITLPALYRPDAATAKRVLEFFTANIRNPNTRKAYARAAGDFATWCGGRGLDHLRAVQPIHVAAYIEELQQRIAAPSVKVQLAAIRMLFDWLVLGQIVPTNPASVVRGPKYVVKKGKTPILSADEARTLLDSIATEHRPASPRIVGLRDRALIALLTYTFSRVGAAVTMRVEDVYTEARRTWVRLHEKGGKRHEMPCHHKLETFLEEYIDAAGIKDDPKGWLFRTTEGQSAYLTENPMRQDDVYRMIRRRADDAGIKGHDQPPPKECRGAVLALGIVIGGKEQPSERRKLEGALKFSFGGQSIAPSQGFEHRGAREVVAWEVCAYIGEFAQYSHDRELDR